LLLFLDSCYFFSMIPAAMPYAILSGLDRRVEDFLERWTANMSDAGFLESTTAKREDCILSFHWFLAPIIRSAENGNLPSFGELIANEDNWADNIIQTSRRHRSRGITGDMFVGCFKTLVHAVLEMVEQGDEPCEQKKEAARFIQRWADAFETLIVQDWTTRSGKEGDRYLDQANRQLTLEKCKYENVINSISELVLTIDGKGQVLEANRSALRYFQKDLSGLSIMELLGLKGESLKVLCSDHSTDAPLEISVKDMHFQCIFAPLNNVSLASDGYIVVLKDVTALVKQSEILETIVVKRTSDLLKKTSQLEEMNITLRTVMKSVDKEREEFQERIGDVIRSTLLPALDPVRKAAASDIRNSYLDIIENQLLKLARGGGQNNHAGLLKLTPMEMKVSRFIQAGSSTKEIAEALNLSVVTIQTHRRNIRKKLGLQNRNVNLTTFLNQSGPLEP